MPRKDDLESLIRSSYDLVREYEGIAQLSSDPKEKIRCQEVLAEQWALIRGWLREYARVVEGQLPEDLRQIATRFDEEGTQVAAAEVVPTDKTVFFAYSHHDQDFALPLAAALRQRGVPVWVAQWDIPAGANWADAINAALYECGQFLIVLSPASMDSQDVDAELCLALDEKKTIVPVLYQECRIHYRLRPVQYVDMTSRQPDDEEALGLILRTLHREQPAPGPMEEGPEVGAAPRRAAVAPPPSPRRKTSPGAPLLRLPRWAWGASALVVIVGLGLLLGPKLWPGEGPSMPGTPTNTTTAGAPTGMPTEPPTSAKSIPTDMPTEPPPPAATATLPPEGQQIRSRDGMVMVYVPAGEFTMGSTNAQVDYAWNICKELGIDCQSEWLTAEQPTHTVNLDAFWIDRTEVTNAQFAAFLNEQGNQVEGGASWLDENVEDTNCRIEQVGGEYRPQDGCAEHPVIFVSWYGSAAYCAWVGGRLPSEAEWEKAARGADGRIYPWGNDPPTCERANNSCPGGLTRPVGSTSPAGDSPYGASDMAGNVAEWVNDWYRVDYYGISPADNPPGPIRGEYRVMRGGDWGSSPVDIRAARRGAGTLDIHYNWLGFRCVVAPGE